MRFLKYLIWLDVKRFICKIIFNGEKLLDCINLILCFFDVLEIGILNLNCIEVV